MNFKKLPIVAVTSALMAAPTLANAWYWHDREEVDLDEAYLFFELNDTDGDLGIHGKADGDAWKRMKIEAPNERTLLNIIVRSKLSRQGLTELFFESAEPTFDELNPTVFFKRFPEGVYEWEGLTLDYKEIEGEMFLSHIMPAAPVVDTVGESGTYVENDDNPGFDLEYDEEEDEDVVAKQCWGVLPDGSGDVVITWGNVTKSHYTMWNYTLGEQISLGLLLDGEELRYDPDEGERKIPLGNPGTFTGDDLVYYEFVAEIDDTEYKSTAVIPPADEGEVNSWTVPAEFITLAETEGEGEVKFEIIVRVYSGEGEDDDDDVVYSTLGNQSAVEDCFEIVDDVPDVPDDDD